jgi:hypothetical protein
MIEAQIQTYPQHHLQSWNGPLRDSTHDDGYTSSLKWLWKSHMKPQTDATTCKLQETLRNNGFHVMCSEPDLKTRDIQSRNWDFHLFSQLWSSLSILLLKLDAPSSSYKQKEIHRQISLTKPCIANQIQNIKK